MPLTAYYNEPWLRRAKLASSLLDAAYKFTYKDDNFGFYLTDISADNIAVDSIDNVKFVDLENVIIVDRNIAPTGNLKIIEKIFAFIRKRIKHRVTLISQLII